MKKINISFICFFVLLSCGTRIQSYGTILSDAPIGLKSLAICRAVGGSIELNKSVAASVEKEMRIHLDTLVGNEQINELLHKNGIISYEDYSKFLIQIIARVSNQRFIIIPTIIQYRESIPGRGNNYQTSQIDITYSLYDSMDIKLLYSTHIKANGDIGTDIIGQTLTTLNNESQNEVMREPSEIIHSLTKVAKEATERLFNYIGIPYDKEATYKTVSKEEYQKIYIAH